MFHYIPASNITSCAYPSPLSNSRDRYLAALAEAKAAEADYLAAEAARREEDDLRRRLAEIQHRKQEQLLLSRYGIASYDYLDIRPSYDRLAIFRQQIEEEERLRLFALREAELEERRRQEQAVLEIEAARLRRARETALRLRQQKEEAHLRALLEQSAKVTEHQCSCSCGNQASRPYCQIACNKPRKQAVPVFHPSVQALLRPEVKVIAPVETKCQAEEESDIVQDLLKQILGISSETSKSKASTLVTTSKPGAGCSKPKVFQKSPSKPIPSQAKEVLDPEKSIEHLLQSIGLSLDQLPQPVTRTNPSLEVDTSDSNKTNHLQEFAKLLVPAATDAVEETISQPSASASSSKPAQDVPVEAAPAVSAPAPAAPEAPTSSTAAQSLKEQLEARLNNEFYSEVRDTIQAIFESLRDSDNHEHSALSNSTSDVASSSKGKAKANETSTISISATPSRNVVDPFNEVRNIDAAFHTLEADFTFPATLDFISSHLVPDNPVSFESESSSATTHLAYTSRNHPVRFYEQALSALLAQLDSIDSDGNDILRATRKEVVSRVEKALGELEKEVEGRYRNRLAKEAKSVPVETTQHPTATTAASDSNKDSTPVPELQVRDPKESTSETAIISEPALTETSANESSLEPPVPAESSLTNTEPTPADIPVQAEEFPPLSSSSATVKGTEVQTKDPAHVSASVETESIDAFLLTTGPETSPKRPNNKDSEDVVSDWSEVEA